jgi:hypothetical protein
MSDSKYLSWSNIELAEAMVETIDRFEDRNAQEIANTWDRCDMIDELIDNNN